MPDKINFTHLHVHTQFSLLDGSSRIEELILRTKELGMDSIAITDHGVMYGVIDFYKEAVKQGVKPIIGCEVYVASKSRFDKDNSKDNFYYHLVLLAENNEGYHNLVKLVSYGFLEGYYYKPRVDIELLRKYSKGLIALSACLAGPVSKTILNGNYEKAKDIALLYENIFGKDNFFLELQDHGMSEQKEVNPQIIRISRETGIKLVCTNDIHYVDKDDAKSHDILLCIQTGKTVNDEDRMRYAGGQFYLKSPEEMLSLFPYIPEALENTYKISERCNVSFEFNKYKLPVFTVPDGFTAYEYLRKLCLEGLKNRYENVTDEHLNRLEFELDTIKNMGFVDYFLIVWDFIKYAKDNDIAVGPGRGSAAGSIVAYSLQITDIDPLKFNLLFERFLNPERVSMPDIDIDFCYERREEVIEYVNRKYGSDHVAQIVTFGTMAARNAIRDVGRALAMSYQEVDKIAKMVPLELKITIRSALSKNPELLREYNENPNTKNLIDMALKLEGLVRHSSTHAAGVVICDKPVIEYVPLNLNDNVITTQFPMTTLEELGLLKMDFLGLRTLTVIQNAIKEIKRIHNVDIDFSKENYDDKRVFELISSGKTEGVFQLESAGMCSFMKDLKPQSIEDIIAGISLYRPGPMDFIPKYIQGKNSDKEIEYLHPKLKPILEPTYGCIVYQEQVMQIVRELAGYSLGRSDMVRRAMSKKKEDVMKKERHNFIYGIEGEVDGCIKRGIPEDIGNKIFDDMTDFAKYAFNKSHAAAYAVVAYQTAYLKTYYPVEFMAALLTSVMDNTNKVTEYINELKKMNIELLPPDINEGFGNFSVSDGKIRFGLSAIKNVGTGNIKAMVKQREEKGPFISMTDFLNRLSSEMNSRCIESLILAGAFDSLGGKRSQYMAIYPQIYDGINQSKKKNLQGQMDLFQMNNTDNNLNEDNLPKLEEYPKKQIFLDEKKLLGVYVSGHPLEEYIDILEKSTNASSLDFIIDENDEFGKCNVTDNQRVLIGGVIDKITLKYTKNNKVMCFLNVEDIYGNIEIIVFPNVYEKSQDIIKENNIILIDGRASISEDEAKIISEKILPLQKNAKSKTLWLKISKDSTVSKEQIKNITAQHQGNDIVIIYEENTKRKFTLNEKINTTVEVIEIFKNLLGEKNVVLEEG